MKKIKKKSKLLKPKNGMIFHKEMPKSVKKELINFFDKIQEILKNE
jgi:hypothetical protein